MISNYKNLMLELPNFEGPLDLLLHLIKSQEIDIYDIPISQITSQYLAYLKQMQNLNLKIAGEYFVMSSTLLKIKSQYLLPKNDFIEDDLQEEDPRDELVQQLVQYSVFKKISHYFAKRNQAIPVTLAKEASASPINTIQPLPLGQITSAELANTFAYLIRKKKLQNPVAVSMKIKETPVTEMISYLKNKIDVKGKISFFSCLSEMKNISDLIGLFLAILELSKNHIIKIDQSRIFGDLQLKRVRN